MHVSVLIIDDEVELTEYTARYFNMSGVDTQYVLDAESARKFLEENTCSLILLDINLGEDSGFELCQTIRSTTNIPIFFISARSSEDDMLLALSIGGDDYICKPYPLSVLLAKVRATLKRYGESVEQSTVRSKMDPDKTVGEDKQKETLIHLGNAVVDLRKATIMKNGQTVNLKAMEFKLLVYMLNHKNRIITKNEFFENVWGTEYVGDVTLNVHIRHLREKIEDDAGNPNFIKTVWGVGFMLDDPD